MDRFELLVYAVLFLRSSVRSPSQVLLATLVAAYLDKKRGERLSLQRYDQIPVTNCPLPFHRQRAPTRIHLQGITTAIRNICHPSP